MADYVCFGVLAISIYGTWIETIPEEIKKRMVLDRYHG